MSVGFNPLFPPHLILISFNPLIAAITPLKLQSSPHLTIFSILLTMANPLFLFPLILALPLILLIIAFLSIDLKLASVYQQPFYHGSLPTLLADNNQSESVVILLLFLSANQASLKDLLLALFFSTFILHLFLSFALPMVFLSNNMLMTLNSL